MLYATVGLIYLVFWLTFKAFEILFKCLFYIIVFIAKLAVNIFMYIIAIFKILFDKLRWSL